MTQFNIHHKTRDGHFFDVFFVHRSELNNVVQFFFSFSDFAPRPISGLNHPNRFIDPLMSPPLILNPLKLVLEVAPRYSHEHTGQVSRRPVLVLFLCSSFVFYVVVFIRVLITLDQFVFLFYHVRLRLSWAVLFRSFRSTLTL